MTNVNEELRLSVFCPYCHERTGISPVRTTAGYPAVSRPRADEIWWMGECFGCHKMMLVFQQSMKISGNRDDSQFHTVYPTPLPSPTDERIPEPIRGDLMEAKLCYSIGAYKACATMARRSLEAACLDKGAAQSNLNGKIDDLYANHIITGDLMNLAHAVRLVGNDGAHILNNQVAEEDAQDILILAEQFFHILYVTAAIAQSQLKKHGKS